MKAFVLVLAVLSVPCVAAAEPICQFAVDHECTPAAAQCHRNVDDSHEADAIRAAEGTACDAKATACAERMRKPAAECARLATTLDATLRATQKGPQR